MRPDLKSVVDSPIKKTQQGRLRELKFQQQIDNYEILQLRAENEQLKARISKLEQVLKDDEQYRLQVFQKKGKTASLESLNI